MNYLIIYLVASYVVWVVAIGCSIYYAQVDEDAYALTVILCFVLILAPILIPFVVALVLADNFLRK